MTIDYDKSTYNVSDVKDISEWAKEAVVAAYEIGIVKGDEQFCFRPKSTITREDMFVITERG